MSKEKQIEEMARDVCNSIVWDQDGYATVECLATAKRLRLKGYCKQEWISVDERLPLVSGKYVCGVKDKNGNTWTVPADWNLEMKMWFGEFGEIKNMVSHWMPLPEAPKMKGGK